VLELYHGDPGANFGKPMMTLEEKGVEFVSHYLNPNFDQHKLEAACAEIETALSRSPWLAGPQYSLADIAVFSMLRGAADMLSDWLDARGAPRMRAWLSKMQDRPAVNEALAFARVERPHSLFVPGPEEIRWG